MKAGLAIAKGVVVMADSYKTKMESSLPL